nr:VTT domain-containing protein [uncultured Rhodopila sp.]
MTLDGFLIAYGAVLILPLSVVEGPAVSAVTGLLASQGYVGCTLAMVLLVCGDLIGDLIYYWIGRSGVTPLSGLSRRLGLGEAFSPEFQRDLKQHSTKMLLVGKWTHAIGCVVLVASGMLRLPIPHFLFVNLLATVPKSGALFAFGYFAGNHIGLFERHAVLGSALLGIAGVSAVALILRRAQLLRARL